MVGVRPRRLRPRRPGRDEDDRPDHRRPRRVRPDGSDPRGRLQAAGRRERPRPEPLALGADPAFTAAVEDVVARISKLDVVQNVRSPLDPANAGQVSTDGRSALVEFEIAGAKDKAAEKIDPVLAQVDAAQEAHPQLFIGEFGDASAAKGVETAFADDLGKAGILSLPVTLVILVLAFGALMAAGIPLLLALTAVFATFGLVAVASRIVPEAMQAGAVVLLIGLAVGVDYSLFYLKRAREERAAGRSGREAIEIAAATSGRAVLVSGFTVIIAMSGMFLTATRSSPRSASRRSWWSRSRCSAR